MKTSSSSFISTTLCEFWLAQLFLSIVSSPASFVSNWSPPASSIIPHVVFPSYSWPSLQSCCIRFPFVYGLATLSLVILFTCPNQLSRLYFMYLTIFSLLIAFSSSSFVLSLHSSLAFCVGPNILLNIFLSNTNNFCLMFFVKTQHSDPHITTGLIRALYNFSLVFFTLEYLLVREGGSITGCNSFFFN